MKEKVAVRVPNHKCTLELLKHCKYIVGTSANVSGTKSTTDPKECERSMKGYDLLLDSGRISSKGESTIIELVEGQLVVHRKGEIKKEDILGVL